jgi:hypothetical protein
MVTCDFDEVKEKTNGFEVKLDECESGEALYCYNLDKTLTCSAEQYFKFAEEVRRWANDVFCGTVIFDPAAETLWKASLENFYQRATRLLSNGYAASGEHGCDTLNGANKLKLALFAMNQLLHPWITPKLAVGPSARQQYTTDPAKLEEGQKRLESLAPLPSDWKPYNKQQAIMLQRIAQR